MENTPCGNNRVSGLEKFFGTNIHHLEHLKQAFGIKTRLRDHQSENLEARNRRTSNGASMITFFSTSTKVPTSSMLLTKAVPLASPSSQMAVDAAAASDSSSLSLPSTVNWSFFGFLLLLHCYRARPPPTRSGHMGKKPANGRWSS